ncbi:MAG: hypothetical protein BWY94_01853 [Actinobacteria bacterium ADurb.BinA094]|nr:MAG: hypothetical protein BWY94_01853 [Actinobacteria bacterium ADurb.BinA094]
MRAVVDPARRLAHGVGGAGALGAVGHARQRRGVGHAGPRLQVRAVLHGPLEPLGHQLDGVQGHGVVEELVVVAGVALDRVGQRVHARGAGDRRRQAQHELRVDQGDVGGDQRGAADVVLDAAPRVGDHRPERHLAAGARRRGDGHERRDAALNGVVTPFVPGDRPAVRGDHADRLGDVHRRASADGDEPVAALGPVQSRRPVDQGDVGVGAHLGEEHGVAERPADAVDDARRDDALVRDQHGASDPQLGDSLRESRQRTRAVDQPRGRVDDADGVDCDGHAASRVRGPTVTVCPSSVFRPAEQTLAA